MTYKQRFIEASKTINKLEKRNRFLRVTARQLRPKSVLDLAVIAKNYFNGFYKRM